MTVRLVVDSSADLSGALVRDLSIEVVPLKVRFGEEELLDGTELSPGEFWARLRTSGITPQTAAPAPGDFEKAFRKVLDEGASGIVCVTLSSKVSATHQAARIAARALSDHCPVAVVDSLSVSAGLANLSVAAARRAAEGADLARVVAEAEELRGDIAFYGAVETLEYLRRGGRIGAASALVGTALSIRPLLRFEQGTVDVAGKVRTRRRALEWLAERIEADHPSGGITAFHADASDIDDLVKLLAAKLPAERIEISLMGPVMGTHLGPGTVGVTYFRSPVEKTR